MPVESTYSAVKEALVARLAARPGLAAANVSDHVPVNVDDLRSPSGRFETIAMGDATGSFSTVVFCGPGQLRFDEELVLAVLVEVHGTDSVDGTQPAVDRRVNELLYELLAEVADQQSWDLPTLGLDVFDYVTIVPATQRWSAGRLTQTGVYAASCEVGLAVSARRSFPN